MSVLANAHRRGSQFPTAVARADPSHISVHTYCSLLVK
jgi:hypothetical protein